MRALVLVALVAACGGSTAAPGPEAPSEPPIPQSPAGIDRAVIEKETKVLEDLATATCACKDRACVEAADAGLVEYARTATMNDSITDLETWPADLDARGRRAMFRMFTCASEHGYFTKVSGVFILRRTIELRAHACACDDLSCTRRVRATMVEFFNDNATAKLEDAETATFTEETAKARRCLEASFKELAQQALLDMRAIRRDACECLDSECAAAVTRRIEDWSQGMNDIATDEATTAEFQELSAEVRVCLEKARESR